MDTASTTSGPQFVGEIGVRGELYIAVDKPEYTAGDTIVGRLTVTVSETIQCDLLTLTLVGEESAQWTEEHVDHHSRYEEFLRHDVLATALPTPCVPGEYLFPFQYTLPPNAPGVLDADSLDSDTCSSRKSNTITALHATIKYSLKASVKVEGRFVSDLEAVHALVVRAAAAVASPTAPLAAAAPLSTRRDGAAAAVGIATAQSVERTVSKRVRLFNCLSRGTCHVAAALATNVLALGDTVRVNLFVNNHTSALAVRRVRVRLVQDVVLNDCMTCSRPLLQVECNGPQSGELLERPVDLLLAGKLRFPTTRGRFLACSYRIRVECDVLFAGSIVLDLPVTICPAQRPLRPLNAIASMEATPRATTAAYAAQLATPTAATTTAPQPPQPPQPQQPFAHLVNAPPPPHPTIDLMA